MRWGDFRRSDNVEDRTDESAGGGFPLGGGVKLGGGAIIVIVIASLFFGVDPLQMLGTIEGVGSGAPAPAPRPQTAPAPGYGPQYPTRPSEARAKDPGTEFVAHVLGDTEDVWGAVFQTMGSRYQPPKLVLFRGGVQSACGRASAAVGPFYCPGDGRLYLDTAFFDELSRRFGAPGDFAQAYVIAHEVGHHVQNVTGTMRRFDQQVRENPSRRNALSVRLELQADCYAGVWGYFAKRRNLLETGDLEEGFRAAAAVGDDQIQKRAQGYAVPESFTHGSAEQRLRWFRTGLDSGDMRVCDTFSVQRP
ncbi:MAG TPA: neutral zinc metallopeptidase [Casimicrobiaceae bacterium]